MMIHPSISNFVWEELADPSLPIHSTVTHCLYLGVDFWAFISKLQALRGEWGDPLRVTSGYRCDRYNYTVGGVPGSQHKRIAADVQTKDLRDLEKLSVLARDIGFTGVGLASYHVHLDNRSGEPYHWTYEDRRGR